MPDKETLKRFITEAIDGCEDTALLYEIWCIAVELIYG